MPNGFLDQNLIWKRICFFLGFALLFCILLFLSLRDFLRHLEFYQSNFWKNILDKPLHSELPFALINPINHLLHEVRRERSVNDARHVKHKVTFHGKTIRKNGARGKSKETMGKPWEHVDLTWFDQETARIFLEFKALWYYLPHPINSIKPPFLLLNITIFMGAPLTVPILPLTLFQSARAQEAPRGFRGSGAGSAAGRRRRHQRPEAVRGVLGDEGPKGRKEGNRPSCQVLKWCLLVISWFIIPLTVDISTISPTY